MAWLGERSSQRPTAEHVVICDTRASLQGDQLLLRLLANANGLDHAAASSCTVDLIVEEVALDDLGRLRRVVVVETVATTNRP